MSILLININPQKEIFHKYDFSFYMASKYRDMELDTYQRTTLMSLEKVQFEKANLPTFKALISSTFNHISTGSNKIPK